MNRDKRKIAVLLILGVLLLGIGAWQILSLSADADNPKTKEKTQSRPSEMGASLPESSPQEPPYWLLGTKRQNPFQPKDLPDEGGNTSTLPQGNMVRPNGSSPKPPAPRVKPNIEIPSVAPPWMVTPTPQAEQQPPKPSEDGEFPYVVVGV
ncbi:MAG: hypothetical protein QXI19_08485, partial [Candidatus Caldarchaeum sp.]